MKRINIYFNFKSSWKTYTEICIGCVQKRIISVLLVDFVKRRIPPKKNETLITSRICSTKFPFSTTWINCVLQSNELKALFKWMIDVCMCVCVCIIYMVLTLREEIIKVPVHVHCTLFYMDALVYIMYNDTHIEFLSTCNYEKWTCTN